MKKYGLNPLSTFKIEGDINEIQRREIEKFLKERGIMKKFEDFVYGAYQEYLWFDIPLMETQAAKEFTKWVKRIKSKDSSCTKITKNGNK